MERLKVLHLNARQLSRYLQTYVKLSDEFNHRHYTEMEKLLKKSQNDLKEIIKKVKVDKKYDGVMKDLTEIEFNYQTYLHSAKEMCRLIWAKFDTDWMLSGGIILLSNVLVFLLLLNLEEMDIKKMAIIFSVHSIILLSTFLSNLITLIIAFPCAIYVLFKCKFTKENMIFYFFIALFNVIHFSNSFVVHEDKILQFLLTSAVWFMAYRTIASSKKLHLLLSVLFFSISLRISREFCACREEQGEEPFL